MDSLKVDLYSFTITVENKDFWTDMLEEVGQIDFIYADFEKAFDSLVHHKKLLSKLYIVKTLTKILLNGLMKHIFR